MANLLTTIRILLVIGTIVVWARDSHPQWWWLDLAMVVLLAWAIFMDALDGWVARRRKEVSES
ncbi:CDP-alcohol phosphatidyltransferase family protein, partial [Candidatus Poribacteria bacterium]|nr:CDP-alcohol phosphatidyltransferase family protein [Candidatus Poribacteria bacterium]